MPTLAPTRRLDRSCLATMKSPIRHVMEHLSGTPFSIAGERQAQFDTELGNFDLIYLPDRPWVFCAKPVTREIFVSRGAIELLWCSSLASFLFYTTAVAGRRFDAPGEIDLRSDPRLRAALDLLRWAMQCQNSGDLLDNWPPGLPQPLLNPTPLSDENVADELTLAAAGFLLHHELAHVRYGHRPDVADALSIEQEKEADIAAAEWVLDGLHDRDDGRFTKRMLGIVNAYLVTNSCGLHFAGLGAKRHPFSYDRLSTLLDRFLGGEDHVSRGYAWAVLSLHFQVSGRKLKKQQFADFREALEAICDQLAEETRDARG